MQTTHRSANGSAYALSGPHGAPVVVLIHGLGLNRAIWRQHEPALAARYRVLVYDLFGHGESAPPPVTPSLSLFATQLRELLDELQVPRAVVAGFSLGGMINRRLAIDHPSRVAALAIFNSPHERDPALQRAVEERAARVAEGGSEATLDEALARWFTPGFRAARTDVMEQVRGWRAAADPSSYPQCCAVLATGVIELIRPAPPITAPTLVMTCENDTGSTPAMARAIAAEIEGARCMILPHLQHMGLVEQPALFTTPLLEFLETLPWQAPRHATGE